VSANWWDAYPKADEQSPSQQQNWWDSYPVADSQDARPRVYDPFANDERALPPLPGEEVEEVRYDRPSRPSYFERVRQAFLAPATTESPQNIGEYIGNVPVIGPLYGLAEAGTTLLTGAAALPLASIKGAVTGREPTSEDIARFTYEPRSQAGRAALGILGAVAQPVVDVAERSGADVALLPLAAEAQALGTVARGRGELREVKRQGQRLSTPPSSQDLAAAAREAYALAKAAGAVAAPESYARMATRLRESLREQGFNPRLHPKASAVLEEIEKMAGQPVSFDELEILRRQALAAERSIEADERRIAGLIIDRLDDYADALASGAEPIVGGNAKAAVEARKQARNFYARSRKAQEMQELMERAEIRASQFSGSGLENALRTEFRQLAMNPKRMRRFTQEEQRAIKEVAFGTPTRNALRQIGKLAPTGGLMQSLSLLGAVLEPTTLVAPAIGGAARIGATKLTQRAARRAEELMRRGSTQPARAAVESAEATAPAIEGELVSRDPLALPAPELVAGMRSAPGTAFSREQMGMTPDVERAGALHPSAPRQTERTAPALPLLPPREAPPIVVDAQGRAALAPDLAAYLDEIGLSEVRGARQPRAEPEPGQNLFAMLARQQEIDSAGAAFDAQRAAAAAEVAARGGIRVEELPRSAVREITLEGEPQNRLSRLAPKPISSTEAIRSLVRRVAERPSDNTHKVIAYEDVVHPAAIEAFMQGGVDVRDYTHVIDSSAVRHILKRHGNKQKEQVRGQLPITEDDLTRLPEIIGNPDAVEYAGKTRVGREAVRYAKVLGDEIFVVEEARTGRKQLAVTSMWKVTRDESMPSVKTQSPLLRPERLRGTLPQRADRNTFAEHIEMSGSSVRRQRAPIEHISTNAFEQLGERP